MSENTNSGWWHRYSENEGSDVTYHVEWIPMLLDEADTILNYVGDIEPRLEISDIRRGVKNPLCANTASFLFKQGDEYHCISWWTNRPDALIDKCQKSEENTLYIIRGLPGSGKTTMAKIIAPDNNHSSDDYFTDKNGVYTFVGAELKYSHWGCSANTEADMKKGVAKVAIHNTFSTSQEASEYFRLAVKYGYRVQVIECQGQFGSTHEVPEHTIQNMRDRWEHSLHGFARRPLSDQYAKGTKKVRCNGCKETGTGIPGNRHTKNTIECAGRWIAIYGGE